MSAVAAILSLDGDPLRAEDWGPMAASLDVFGSDCRWQWSDGSSVVLMRALDELTPSDVFARKTAMAGDWVLVGDVRLDARDDLSRALGLCPAEAAMLPDEQLFAHALEKWGMDAPIHLNGGFGVIAWERSRRRLHLWRDANGERPLYFHRSGRRVFVASHAPILLAAPGVPREVDVKGLLDFMAGSRRPARTSLRGIEALQAARHHVFDEHGGHDFHFYRELPDLWEWTRTEIKRPIEAFRTIFTEAVSDRLRTLGTKGGFCSGGLDSTSISALAAAELGGRGEQFSTYTAVPHPDWREPARSAQWEDDDSPYVRALVRRHPNIEATFVAVDGGIFLDCLPKLFRETASPAGNPSNLPWAFAIRALQREAGVRMPFTGGGGNGSISLDSEILLDLLRAGRPGLLAMEWHASPGEFVRSCRILLRAMKSGGSGFAMPRIYLKAAAGAAAGWAPRSSKGLPSLAHTRRRFEDIAKGALGAGYAGLERLDPTKDRRVVDLCRRLSPREFRHGGERRRLIRRAMRGLLPEEIRLRTTRGAQSPDLWLHLDRRRGDLRAAVAFIAEDDLCSALIDIAVLKKCLDDWPERPSASLYSSHVVFATSIAMGLYIRWIRDGLDNLPGCQPIRPLVIEG